MRSPLVAFAQEYANAAQFEANAAECASAAKFGAVLGNEARVGLFAGSTAVEGPKGRSFSRS